MSMNFPWWFVAGLILIEYWPLTVLATLLLSILGFVTKGVTRWLFLALPVMILLASAGLGLYLLGEHFKDERNHREYQASYNHRHVILSAPRTVQGLDLPTGTDLHYKDDALTKLDTADLPHPSPILGTVLAGHISGEYQYWWDVELPADTVIGGWPCRSGKIQLTLDGGVNQCVLSRLTTVQAPRRKDQPMAPPLQFPAGTTLSESSGSDIGHDFSLPEHEAIRLTEVNALAPGFTSIKTYPNGAIREVYANREPPFLVRGIPFVTDAQWIYPEDLPEDSPGPVTAPLEIYGELADDLLCDEQRFTTGSYTLIHVNLRASTVRFTTFTQHEAHPDTSPIPTSRCHIVPPDPASSDAPE